MTVDDIKSTENYRFKSQSGLKKFSNYRIQLIFWVLLLAVAWSYNYPEILSKGPYSIHQWRQADCLSITQNFYVEDRPFLEPAIHWVGEADGRTVSECPIIYYSVAKLWRWFGKEYWMFRLINILLVFLGLWSLFRLTLRVTSSPFWSVALPLFLFSSPILAYYTNNFMADAPAFGLALTAGYLAYLGVVDRKRWAYYLAFLVFLAAGLIKVSALILFIALGMLHGKYAVRGRLHRELTRWSAWWPYVVVGCGLIMWYGYANRYNEANVSWIFLTGLFPIWDLDGEAIRSIWWDLTHTLLPAYFIRQGLWLCGILFGVLLWNYKKGQRFWLQLTLLISAGLVGFVLLFYQAFTVHDYYLTNLLIIIPVLLLAVLDMGKAHFRLLLKNKWVRGFAVLVVTLLIYKTALTNRMKYDAEDPWLQYNFVIADWRIQHWRWFHYDYQQHEKDYETIKPYLRSLGINREDRVLSYSDLSINISLYLMDQKGFSSFGFGAFSLDEKMAKYKQYGVQYVIVDEASDDPETIAPYLGEKIGDYQNLGIYEFRL